LANNSLLFEVATKSQILYLFRKEAEFEHMANRLEDEQSLVARLQRQIKELLARVQELEEELDAERAARVRAEKARAELQVENEEMAERMEEAGGATQTQIEQNKRREAEMAKLRREMVCSKNKMELS
jgi:chromosome segregation ATPase